LKYVVTSGKLKNVGLGLGGSYYKDQHGWTVKKTEDDPEVLFDYKSLNAAAYYTIHDLVLAFNIDNITDAFNFYGGFNYNFGKNGEYDYIALPGRNWRLSLNYKF
jgi:iron complex outermembrane recepter protein